MSNIDSRQKYKYELFTDRTFSNFYVELKFTKFFKKHIEKKDIFGDNKDFFSEFAKQTRLKEQITQISDEIGNVIRKYLKEYNEPEDEETTDEESDKESDDENEDDTDDTDNEQVVQKVEKPEIKSCFIIPIMIIPCKTFKQELLKITEATRVKSVFKHVSNCKKCDLTNNNERVSLDMVNIDMPYYKMTDKDEVYSLLQIYHSLSYYETKRFRMIEILDEKSDYFGCFCIIGRMQKEY
jgi:type III secretory pathway component EscR